jgi:hypothetical protein
MEWTMKIINTDINFKKETYHSFEDIFLRRAAGFYWSKF